MIESSLPAKSQKRSLSLWRKALCQFDRRQRWALENFDKIAAFTAPVIKEFL
jgi:hypothetical protein